MTEEQTFQALLRTPFRTVFLHVTADISLGETIGVRYANYLLDNGWTVEQFQQEVFDRKIALSVTSIKSIEWRDRFKAGLIH